MPNPVVHFEIRARDIDQQRAFYSQLFGWQVGEPDPLAHYRMVASLCCAIPRATSSASWAPDLLPRERVS